MPMATQIHCLWRNLHVSSAQCNDKGLSPRRHAYSSWAHRVRQLPMKTCSANDQGTQQNTNTKHNTTQHNTIPQNTTQHNRTQHKPTQTNTTHVALWLGLPVQLRATSNSIDGSMCHTQNAALREIIIRRQDLFGPSIVPWG